MGFVLRIEIGGPGCGTRGRGIARAPHTWSERPGGRRARGYMFWSIWSWRMSAESRITICFPVFFHQCDVAAVSRATSPVLCTMGTEQLLAYSVTSAWTMSVIRGRSALLCERDAA